MLLGILTDTRSRGEEGWLPLFFNIKFKIEKRWLPLGFCPF
jgi:hypothetical protein